MPTAAWWKEYYARERVAVDLGEILDLAPEIDFPKGGALIFPHTRLSASGTMVGAVAKAAARTRRDVLAIGVLHGAPAPRGVHDEAGGASQEFSLDNFRALHAEACLREGVASRVVSRYPYQCGERPEDLPGLEELRQLAKDRILVATADPIHHGVGYQTAEAHDESRGETLALAQEHVAEQLAALARADFPQFARLCARDRSDFRDAGPALALLLPQAEWSIEELRLVNYADVLGCARPTWVAAGRIRVHPRSPGCDP